MGDLNITFLVGNGFDREAGYNTSYGHFYAKYSKPAPEDKPHIKKLRESIKNSIKAGSELWADFEVGLGNYTVEFNEHTVEDLKDCFIHAQSAIAMFLLQETESFKAANISADAIRRLRDGLTDFYADEEIGAHDILEEFFNNNQNQNRDWRIRFISFNHTTVLDEYIRKCENEGALRTQGPRGKYKYTIDPNVVHVHGPIWEAVLGVNDETQIACDALRNNHVIQHLMIKTKVIDTLGKDWGQKASWLIETSDIICIFGMSLGITDEKWWKKIASWLCQSSNHKLIIFWCNKQLKYGASAKSGEIMSVRAKFNDYVKMWKNSDDFRSQSSDVQRRIGEIERQIYIAINTQKVLQLAVMPDESTKHTHGQSHM